MSFFIENRRMAGNTVLRVLIGLLILIVVGGLIYGTYIWQQQKVDILNQRVAQLDAELATANKPKTTPVAENVYTSKKGIMVKAYTPNKNSSLVSPVVVMGEVPGSWSFEASFPVKLIDAKGNVVAQVPAQLLGDWMTENLVPFTVKLPFSNASSGDGTLLLQKDNPSGLEANDDSVSIPVKL